MNIDHVTRYEINKQPWSPSTSNAGSQSTRLEESAADETQSLRAIFDHANLNTDLAALEQLLLERTASQSTDIAAAGAQTVRAGGKRLRAAQVLLAAQLGPIAYTFDRASHAAAAVELIHAASLVHDDLVDHTTHRRGYVTVHHHWSPDVALMLGDYLFALAAHEMALAPDPRVVTYYAEAVQTIVAGELNAVTDVAPLPRALNEYMSKIGAKTAALFEAGCKAGMAIGGGTADQIDALGHYGYCLGMAFQIIDDVLDFVGDSQMMGKPAGNDLREGTITLPLIYAFARSESTFLRDIAGRKDLSELEIVRAIREVMRHGGIGRAHNDARNYVQRAQGYLERFADVPARQTLHTLGDFVLERHS